MYYRYYHDPGDHNTRAHYGVHRTHKLIYFWKKDQWEIYDLVNDPLGTTTSSASQGRRRSPPRSRRAPRLKQSVRDEDQLANEQLPDGVDGTVAMLREMTRSMSSTGSADRLGQ
jgi:hypothetical protein